MTVGMGDLLFGIALTGVAIREKINRHRTALGRAPVFMDRESTP